MGFYGNTTNIAKTQFTFDRIYPNRVEMDKQCKVDGVYIGRRVLVEYDSETTELPKFYTLPDDNGEVVFSLSKNLENENILVVGSQTQNNNIAVGTIVAIPAENNYKSDIKYTEFWRCNGSVSRTIGGVSKECAGFVQETSSNYTLNYNIDINEYGPSRGYDSTVWEKVITDSEEKYVMIAELNSVVPTFDLAADAPTEIPLTPHFDAKESTNLYYKLHWQPNWGVRLKAENNALKDNGHLVSLEGESLKSDEITTWSKTTYNKETGKKEIKYAHVDGDNVTWLDTPGDEIPAAIYYNKAGLDSDTRVIDEETKNQIIIRPTGQSCNLYGNHDGSYGVAPDIYEISVQLPIIGNAISKVWDSLYGTERAKDISWKEPGEEDTGTRDLETLAGCINASHDLMGMIVSTSVPTDLENADKDLIYLVEGKYYRIGESVQYTESADSYNYIEVNLTAENYMPNFYFKNTSGEVASGEYNSNLLYYKRIVSDMSKEYYVTTADENNYFRVGQKWNNASHVPPTLKLGTKTTALSLIEMRNLKEELQSLYGLILETNRYLDEGSELSCQIQDLLDRFEDNINPGEIPLIDDLGRVSSATIETGDHIIVSTSTSPLSPTFGIYHNTKIIGEAEAVEIAAGTNDVISTTEYDFDECGHANIKKVSNYTIKGLGLEETTEAPGFEVEDSYLLLKDTEGNIAYPTTTASRVITSFGENIESCLENMGSRKLGEDYVAPEGETEITAETSINEAINIILRRLAGG